MLLTGCSEKVVVKNNYILPEDVYLQDCNVLLEDKDFYTIRESLEGLSLALQLCNNDKKSLREWKQKALNKQKEIND